MDNIKLPFITVITVVYNESSELEKTICSVISQTYENYEYIIIDGGSTDGTLDVIKKYNKDIELWVSESDKGIYDAMNKGVRLSKGSWAIFMNCGDIFVSSSILTELSSYLKQSCDLVYGDVNILNIDNVPRLCESKRIKYPLHKIPACHQAILTKTKFLRKYPFNLKYLLAADFDSFCNIVSNKGVAKKIPLVVASVSAGGASDINRIVVYNECEDITKKYFGDSINSKIYFSLRRIIERVKLTIKKALIFLQ